MDNDWDLHALVRSCTAAVTTTINNNTTTQDPFAYTCPTPFVNHDEDDPFWFPNLYEPQNTNPFQELEQLYKPFFSTTNLNGFTDPKPQIHLQKQYQFHQKERASPAINATTSGPGSRRKKNQQKRVVRQVMAEQLSADIWAWRKYGQKPIKGSSYPRNYYRCSSSKGCLARKLVERSHSDPNMFILTYIGEHSHPRPTHRNCLAGSTRNKYSTAAAAAVEKTISTDHDKNPEKQQQPITNSSSPILSPTTPLIPQLQDEKINGDDVDEMEEQEFDGEDLLMPNMKTNEDFFMGLQELGQGGSASIIHGRH